MYKIKYSIKCTYPNNIFLKTSHTQHGTTTANKKEAFKKHPRNEGM